MQIVEVINHPLRELQQMRSSYNDGLREALGAGDLQQFSGCRVTLVDSSEPPYLPNVNSKKGQESLRLLADQVREIAADIQSLPVKKRRVRKIRIREPEREVGVIIERIAIAGESVPYSFKWTGGGPGYREDVSRGLLTAAVRSKIEKRYGKPKAGEFILLAYSIDTPLHEDDPDVAEARSLLAQTPHPFDEVWFLFPYADQELGHIIKVWPPEARRS